MCIRDSLISIIGLLNREYEGEYLYDGISISALKDRDLSILRANNIGFVFQNYSLIKPFSPSLLVVRVNALFRRVEMNIPVKADISFGDVCFSWEKHNAIVKEHDIGLTMTESVSYTHLDVYKRQILYRSNGHT